MRPAPELQGLLAQLARFYRENETSISPAQVSKCQERLPASDVSALSRLFGLFLHQIKQVSGSLVLVSHSAHSNRNGLLRLHP